MFYAHVNLEYFDVECEEILFDPLNPAKVCSLACSPLMPTAIQKGNAKYQTENVNNVLFVHISLEIVEILNFMLPLIWHASTSLANYPSL